MAKGGKRPNAGRIAGTHNKSTNEIKTIIDNAVSMDELITKMVELVRGVTVSQPMGDNMIIYTKPPDVGAAKLILEYRYGKPHQSLDVSQDNNMTIRFLYDDGN